MTRYHPSARKAGKMLKHGTVRGKKLTENQKRFFRALQHGWKPKGK